MNAPSTLLDYFAGIALAQLMQPAWTHEDLMSVYGTGSMADAAYNQAKWMLDARAAAVGPTPDPIPAPTPDPTPSKDFQAGALWAFRLLGEGAKSLDNEGEFTVQAMQQLLRSHYHYVSNNLYLHPIQD